LFKFVSPSPCPHSQSAVWQYDSITVSLFK